MTWHCACFGWIWTSWLYPTYLEADSLDSLKFHQRSIILRCWLCWYQQEKNTFLLSPPLSCLKIDFSLFTLFNNIQYYNIKYWSYCHHHLLKSLSMQFANSLDTKRISLKFPHNSTAFYFLIEVKQNITNCFSLILKITWLKSDFICAKQLSYSHLTLWMTHFLKFFGGTHILAPRKNVNTLKK